MIKKSKERFVSLANVTDDRPIEDHVREMRFKKKKKKKREKREKNTISLKT